MSPTLGLTSSTGRASTTPSSGSRQLGTETILENTENFDLNHWHPDSSQALENESNFLGNGYQMSLDLMSMFETAEGSFMGPSEVIGPSLNGYADQQHLAKSQGWSAFEDPRFSELMLGLF